MSLRMRAVLLLTLLVVANGCATTRSGPEQFPTKMSGLASWYGEEFAGRTTANGEIFDPLLLTAAHRTLPFGTILDVRNPKNGKNVQVRINDRGPFVGNRAIDLSYAAAERLGMVQSGIAPVDISVLKIGRGDREPPTPYIVRVAGPGPPVRPADAPPPISFPLPGAVASPSRTATPTEDGGFRVEVVEERGGRTGRKQVSADGKSLEVAIVEPPPPPEIPVRAIPVAPPPAAAPAPAPAPPPRTTQPTGSFILQFGAFQLESNASALQGKVAALVPDSFIDRSGALYRVRLGPFPTRAAAIEMRARIEAKGLSAIVMPE